MVTFNNNDTALEYEDSNMNEEENLSPRKSTWLIPLLLIPIFFVLGWVANDFSKTNPNQTMQEYGVGGGPDVQVWPSPTPMSWIPTDMPSPSGSSGSAF